MSKVKIGKIIFMKIKRENIFYLLATKTTTQRKYALQGPYQAKEVFTSDNVKYYKYRCFRTGGLRALILTKAKVNYLHELCIFN